MCKATDAVSVKCREVARVLAEMPVEVGQGYLRGLIVQMYWMTCGSGSFVPVEARCEALVACGVCETLVARCSSPWGDGLFKLVTLLGRLANVVDGAKRLAAAPTYELLAELFHVHIGDENAAYVGCYLLVRLADCGTAEGQPMPAGLVEGVVAAVRAHPASVRVVDEGVPAIAFLAGSTHPDNRIRLVAAGAVEVVKGALLAFRDTDAVREFGNKALEVLLGQHGHRD